MRILKLTLLFIFLALPALAKEIRTNEVIMPNAPDWLLQSRVERVTDRIQDKLEWSTRRIEVKWFTSQAEFEKAHSLGPNASAVTRQMNGISVIYLGPTVDNSNFDAIFGHEMVHVIVNQKYKSAIPKWLEEGLANYLAKRGAVDYVWLAKQPFPDDVHNLAHPFQGSADGIHYRYMASQAFAEMLDKKCDLLNLIRLSVERNLEDYIHRTCEIKDLNVAFRDWVHSKSGR